MLNKMNLLRRRRIHSDQNMADSSSAIPHRRASGVLIRDSLVGLAVTAVALAQPSAANDTESVQAKILGAELVRAGSESIQVDFSIEAESQRAVRIRSLNFRGLSANGMAAHIAPLKGAVAMPANQPIRLEPLRATFYFREMDSLAPLRALVEHARIRIEGTARIEIELGWIERLALWSRRGTIWQPFDQSLDVYIPGGVVRELSAKALFAVAEPIVQAGWELRRRHRAWVDETWSQATESAVVVRTVHEYRRKGEAPAKQETLVTGVAIAPGRILVPLQAIEPWQCDPATAFALERGAIEAVVRHEVEVLAPPAGEAPRRVLRWSRAQVRVQTGRRRKERVLLLDQAGKTRKVKVCRRWGEGSLAALEVPSMERPQRRRSPPAAPGPGRTFDVAAMRLIRPPEARGRWWEIVQLRGVREGAEIRLAEPVDQAVIGSPLLLEGAPIGIVQHEYGGVVLPTLEHGN